MSRYPKKIPEYEKPFSGKFINHSFNVGDYIIKTPYIQFVSIDPAIKNYCFRIERRYDNGKIETVVFWKKDFSSSENRYIDLVKVLEVYSEEYSKTHVFLVEEQIRENYNSVRISQHTLTYFSLISKGMPLNPHVIEINNKLKYKYNDAPKGRTESFLKKWSVDKVVEIFIERGDEFGLKIIKEHINRSKDKGDDLADTVLQLNAYCEIVGIKPKSIISNIEIDEKPKKTIIIIKKPNLEST